MEKVHKKCKQTTVVTDIYIKLIKGTIKNIFLHYLKCFKMHCFEYLVTPYSALQYSLQPSELNKYYHVRNYGGTDLKQ